MPCLANSVFKLGIFIRTLHTSTIDDVFGRVYSSSKKSFTFIFISNSCKVLEDEPKMISNLDAPLGSEACE